MAVLKHALLGDIDLSTPGTWTAKQTLDGHDVGVDLTLDGPDVPEQTLRSIFAHAEDLAKLDRAARAAIDADAESDEDEEAADLYAAHHLSELSDTAFERIFAAPRHTIKPATLLARLVLVHVGLYPESDLPIRLDYSIGQHDTNYVLCVSFDAEGNATEVDLES